MTKQQRTLICSDSACALRWASGAVRISWLANSIALVFTWGAGNRGDEGAEERSEGSTVEWAVQCTVDCTAECTAGEGEGPLVEHLVI